MKAEPKSFTPERLAKIVFVEAPRTFSFSHRPPGSLRHPYLPFVLDLMETVPVHKRVECILEAFLDAKNEAEKWKRVGAVFDAKMSSPEFDKKRTEILTSAEVMVRVEALWSLLGGTQGSFLTNDVYRQFHTRLYSILLGSDDVSLAAATITAVNEDYAYDARDFAGISYGSFALSVLEVADNWTKSRQPTEYAAFFQRILDSLVPVSRRFSSQPPPPNPLTEICLSENVFFCGGILIKHQSENHVQYAKVPM